MMDLVHMHALDQDCVHIGYPSYFIRAITPILLYLDVTKLIGLDIKSCMLASSRFLFVYLHHRLKVKTPRNNIFSIKY